MRDDEEMTWLDLVMLLGFLAIWPALYLLV